MSNEMTIVERAERALGFADRKAELAQLAEQSIRIVALTNAAGRDECHAARMQLKTTRVAIQKAGKDAREDATAFSKAVIAKEKELVGIIEPEEARLQRLQDEWEAAREAERQAKVRVEAERVGAIQRRIQSIRDVVAKHAGAGSADIGDALADLQDFAIDEGFAEFAEQATAARDETIAKLIDLHAAAVEREAAAAREAAEREAERQRLAAERAELEQLRKEAEARRHAEEQAAADRRAAEEAELLKARQAQEAELRAERERLAAERAEADRQAAHERARLAAIAAEQESERKRLQDIEDAKAKAAADLLAAERAELARQQAEAEARERQRVIDSATLIEAAAEAHELLTSLAPDHITTVKLGAVLVREQQRKAA